MVGSSLVLILVLNLSSDFGSSFSSNQFRWWPIYLLMIMQQISLHSCCYGVQSDIEQQLHRETSFCLTNMIHVQLTQVQELVTSHQSIHLWWGNWKKCSCYIQTIDSLCIGICVSDHSNKAYKTIVSIWISITIHYAAYQQLMIIIKNAQHIARIKMIASITFRWKILLITFIIIGIVKKSNRYININLIWLILLV